MDTTLSLTMSVALAARRESLPDYIESWQAIKWLHSHFSGVFV
jgi:hypothetical protein